MTYVYAHQTWEWDEEMYQIQLEKWGRLGIPQVYMPRVNIQHMFHELMGIEATIFALCDYPEALKNFSRFMKKRMNSLLR